MRYQFLRCRELTVLIFLYKKNSLLVGFQLVLTPGCATFATLRGPADKVMWRTRQHAALLRAVSLMRYFSALQNRMINNYTCLALQFTPDISNTYIPKYPVFQTQIDIFPIFAFQIPISQTSDISK